MAVFLTRATGVVLVCLISQFGGNGWAQNYPVKVVRYLVPTPAGSGADTIGRIVAGGLSQVFGQQVVVDNRAGGGNNIGAEIAAKAPPDGYTVFQATLTHAVNATVYRKLAYDLVRDFAPVTQLASSPYVLVVHPSLPVKSATELVKLAKARPGAINFASAGPGTATFLAGELFKDIAGINMLHVPYRGGGEALTSVISGETSVYFAPVAIALPFIKEGRFRPLAVTTAQRLPALPSYPTVAEAGYPGYLAGNWFGLMVPAKTPKETIATIRAAAISVLKDPDASKRLRDLGYILIGDQPEEFAAHVRSEIERLGKIVRRAGVTVE
jgi:tripartite-type tricarboxylate transporter receptor subunit TctC